VGKIVVIRAVLHMAVVVENVMIPVLAHVICVQVLVQALSVLPAIALITVVQAHVVPGA
jgi:hypothetical protein